MDEEDPTGEEQPEEVAQEEGEEGEAAGAVHYTKRLHKLCFQHWDSVRFVLSDCFAEYATLLCACRQKWSPQTGDPRFNPAQEHIFPPSSSFPCFPCSPPPLN